MNITAGPGLQCTRTMAVKRNVITDNLVCGTALTDQATTITDAIRHNVR